VSILSDGILQGAVIDISNEGVAVTNAIWS
jgi:hypothetical protein